MKKKPLKWIIIIIALFSSILRAQTAYLCGKEDAIKVLDGEYIVYNNIWGSGAGEQCIDVDGVDFTVSLSTHNSTGVAAYPCIYKGYHHWHSETDNSGMPIKISDIGSVPITWDIEGTNAGGTWNAAYESWFSQSGHADPANGGELMIWINYAGSATPGGTKVGSLNIEGYNWDVYYADWDWNYIAYRITNRVNSVSFDLKPFIDDCVSRGYLNSSWHLDALEAGFEIWRDGQGLRSVSFSGSVNSGGTPATTWKEENEQSLRSPLNIEFEEHSVKFRLFSSQNVSLNIFDTRGKKLVTLGYVFLSEGVHRVSLPTFLMSGVYIMVLKHGKSKVSKKLIKLEP